MFETKRKTFEEFNPIEKWKFFFYGCEVSSFFFLIDWIQMRELFVGFFCFYEGVF